MKKIKQLCVLCGIKEANKDKREHIPARCFFVSPIPEKANLITVPACDDCNYGTKDDDEKFKALLSLSVGHLTPDQKKLWNRSKKSAFKTIKSNQRLDREIKKTIREDLYFDPMFGAQLRHKFSWECDHHNRVITKIIKGLFFHETGKILSPKSEILIELYDRTSGFPKGLLEFMERCPDTKIIEKCGSQFLCQYAIASDVDNASIWLIQFYEAHYVFASTKPPVISDELSS